MSSTQRTLNLFEQALAFEAASQRAAFLERECAGEPALLAEVRALLDADAAAGNFLAQPLSAASGRSGERLGAYRLTRLIGNGGMGSVYCAERADGAFAKPVAIKLLLFDAGDLRTRFALEQRILGGLSHPNIASLIDVGNDANGAPYLVMEYVEGSTITQYVHDRQLDLRARIALFLKILDAVQNAHGQLIVHRDIKPSNVLVDAHDEPKLLDFGIAKLADNSMPAMTRTGRGPLTPEYASPEQVRGDPIGIASDIYSLGVLLYELTTGERPYRIDVTRASAIEKIVCNTDPPRPSTRLGSQRIGGNVRDLDAIILKALEKQAARRYASCAAFAEDLQRWLGRKEVLARQPPWLERSMRVLRRYRLATAVAATATITLIAGSAVALWQAHIAQQQAHIARSERDRAQRINRFLSDTLAAANPADLGRRATVVQVLDRAHQLADKELSGDAQSAASAQLVLAQTYRALGDFDAAQACGEAALKAAKQYGDYATLIDAESALGNVYFDKSNLPQARAMFERARADAVEHGDASQRGSTALQLGQVENEEGNGTRAQSWLQLAVAELPESAVEERATALDSRGFAADLAGDKSQSIALRREAIASVQRAFPHGHPLITTFSVNLANALQKDGQFDEAVRILDTVLPVQIETLGEYHSDIVWTLTTLTTIERKRMRFDAALGYAQRAYQVAQHLSDDNDWKAYAYEKYGDALIADGHAQDAIPILDKALAIDRAMLPADHQSIATVETIIALAQSKVDGRPSGEALANSAYQRLLAKYGAGSEFTIAAKSRLDQIRALAAAPAAAH
jgi:eukaryotic-like serine/threonine-protein kinase